MMDFDPLGEIWAAVRRLEGWAKEPHSTPFKHPVSGDRIEAFFKLPDGGVEKFLMFKLDYDAARERHPDLWTTDKPEEGVEVIDKTSIALHNPPPPGGWPYISKEDQMR